MRWFDYCINNDFLCLYSRRLSQTHHLKATTQVQLSVSVPFTHSLVTRSNYLVALSNIISNIPKEILLPELPSLLPLLLQSLNLPSPVLRANAINTLYVMVIESPEIISSHMETMIPILTNQITLSPANPPKVRIAALRCLAILPTHLNFTAIESFQKIVIRAIGGVLDDPKRVIRKEAVDCRHAWYTSSGKMA